MIHVGNKKGFTLIELMLAMSFISVLLIAIAMTVIQISNIYNHGLTVKDMNQSSRAISTELQRGISQSAPFSTTAGVGNHYIQSAWGGRLCVGQFSYIWNYGVNLNNAVATNNYTNANLNVYSSSPSTLIRFVKIPDTNAAYCTSDVSGKYPDVDSTKATDVLSVGDHSLAVHAFNVASAPGAIDTKSNERLYTITFTLGTNNQAALVTGSTACKAASVAGADPAYCAVQQFTLVVRAGNAIR
jgi:prepilin-type N-terminal cleavage/methylation domain-containing protein